MPGYKQAPLVTNVAAVHPAMLPIVVGLLCGGIGSVVLGEVWQRSTTSLGPARPEAELTYLRHYGPSIGPAAPRPMAGTQWLNPRQGDSLPGSQRFGTGWGEFALPPPGRSIPAGSPWGPTSRASAGPLQPWATTPFQVSLLTPNKNQRPLYRGSPENQRDAIGTEPLVVPYPPRALRVVRQVERR